MAWAGWSAEDIFWQLAVEDIRTTADLFKALYESTEGGDGFVSLEVDPNLAHDTTTTLQAAKRLWKWVDRPNLMIKIRPRWRVSRPSVAPLRPDLIST